MLSLLEVNLIHSLFNRQSSKNKRKWNLLWVTYFEKKRGTRLGKMGRALDGESEALDSDCSCASLFFLINLFIYLFIYLWLCWVFIAACGLSLVSASRGYSLLRCAGFSFLWLLVLRSTGSRHAGFSSCGTQAQ